jgi:hypothetical protein
MAMIRFILFSIILTISLPAVAGRCRPFVLEAGKQALRYKYEAIAAPNSGPALSEYAIKHFQRLDDSLNRHINTLGPSPTLNPEMVFNSGKLLKRVAHEIEKKDVLNLEVMSRLSFLYMQLFDLFSAYGATALLSYSDPLHAYRDQKYISVLNSSYQDILTWVKFQPESLQLKAAYWNGSFENKNGWRSVPTFAQLGFSSMLWAMSRGILFEGQTEIGEKVDGQIMWPSRYQGHDKIHNNNTASRKYKLSYKRFWDRFESEIENVDHSYEQKQIIYLSLFFLIHEEGRLTFECPKAMFDIESTNRMILRRVQNKNDLGQALATPVSKDDVDLALNMISQFYKIRCR